MRLNGKVAVITGAASGIGAASARRFVQEGCRVVLGDIQRERGDALVAELGSAAVFKVCDVTREEDVAALVDLAVDHFGQLDIMFNNAGIVGSVGPIDTTVAAEWSATLDILLNGVLYGMKYAARVMKPQGSGVIINMSSTAGLVGGLGLAPALQQGDKYAMAQAAHGSAPDIAGQGIADPYAEVMSMQMLLAWLGRAREDAAVTRAAAAMERAVKEVIAEAVALTPDLGGTASTGEMGDAIAEKAGLFAE